MKKVLVIVGPTAVGKTALSIEIAKQFNGEIISGDSMQVYKELDIGTAKITVEEQANIKHHLINCREINERYSVADFQKEGRQAIDEIIIKGKLPIIVGGTGLYIQSLLYDFQLGSSEEISSSKFRQKYTAFAKKNGNKALWQELQKKDPKAAEHIHFNNKKRVIRALEVFEETGESILAPKQTPKPLYDYLLIGLETERNLLYSRINQRVDLMMAAGLMVEAKRMYNLKTVQAVQGIGYKEFFPYFMGEISLEKAVEKVKQHSRQYAKRQLTWFKNRMQVQWWDLIKKPYDLINLKIEIEQWLNR